MRVNSQTYTPQYRLGIMANLGQFLVQTVLVFFVGITVGLERNVVPILAKEEFAIASTSVILSFVVSFGFVKAVLNLFGGQLSETWGRRPVLVLGWIAAVPVPLMIIWASNWWWIVAANVLLGINQGLAWSMTVTSKMDLVGAKWRGLGVGINEFAGYSGVAAGALVTGFLAARYGLRPVPFYFGLAVILAGLGIAVTLAKETRGFSRGEAYLEAENRAGKAQQEGVGPCVANPGLWNIFRLTSWGDKAMFSASLAGLLHKFADALVWVSFPLYFNSKGLGVSGIGLVVGAYGFTWGISQLAVGPLTDRIGRKWPVVAGLVLCGAGVWLTLLVEGIGPWMLTAALTGFGIALLYPTLLAVIGDVSNPVWRGASLGVYRMWRDSGYGFGALAIGFISDWLGLSYGFYFTSLVMFMGAVLVAFTMYETSPSRRKRAPEWHGNATCT